MDASVGAGVNAQIGMMRDHSRVVYDARAGRALELTFQAIVSEFQRLAKRGRVASCTKNDGNLKAIKMFLWAEPRKVLRPKASQSEPKWPPASVSEMANKGFRELEGK